MLLFLTNISLSLSPIQDLGSLPSSRFFSMYMTEEEWDAAYGTSIERLLNQKVPLKDVERKRLFKEAEEMTRNAMLYFSKAEAKFDTMLDIKLKDFCKNILATAITSVVIPGARAKAITLALATLSSYAVGVGEDFWDGYELLQVSRRFAYEADRCQDRLLRP